MSLTKHVYSFNGKQVECWVIKIEDETWWKALDVCKFLGFTNASRTVDRVVVKPEWKKTYFELMSQTNLAIQKCIAKENHKLLQHRTIFINEPAFHRLISISKKPEAIAFSEWIYQTILPTLRKTGEFKINQQLELKENELSLVKQDNTRKDQMIQGLINANQQLTSAFSQMSDANQRMSEMMKDVIDKPSNPNQLHSIVLVKVHEKELRCLRRQKGSMEPALKKLKKTHPHLEELYRQDEVPNATNAWSVIKEEIAAMDPDTRFKFNRAFLKRLSSDDVASIMEGLSNSKEIKILEI